MFNIHIRIALLIIIICFAKYSALSQYSLLGKVIDDYSEQPIQYATIVFNSPDEEIRTLTNVDGEFTLNTKTSAGSIHISHIGYNTLKVQIDHNDSHDFRLLPSTVILEEITVNSNPALAFIKAAWEKAYENHKQPHHGKGFFRSFTKVKNDYTAVSEIFFDAKWHNYGMTGWAPKEARYAEVDKDFPLTNMSFITFLASGFVGMAQHWTPLINSNPDSVYAFEIRGFINKGDPNKEIVIINCLLHDNLKKAKDAVGYFEGDYYINTSTYDVYKVDGQLMNMKFSTKGPVRIKFQDAKVIAEYVPSIKDGHMVLSHAALDINVNIRYGGLIKGGEVKFSSRLFMMTEDPAVANTEFIDVKKDVQDSKTIQNTSYNPQFWRDNPVIKRTPLEEEIIKSFEDKKLMGNYFD